MAADGTTGGEGEMGTTLARLHLEQSRLGAQKRTVGEAGGREPHAYQAGGVDAKRWQGNGQRKGGFSFCYRRAVFLSGFWAGVRRVKDFA
jgi:hypothetical protein